MVSFAEDDEDASQNNSSQSGEDEPMEDVDKGEGESEELANGAGDNEADGEDGEGGEGGAVQNEFEFESPVRRVSFADSLNQTHTNGFSTDQQDSPRPQPNGQAPSTPPPRLSPSSHSDHATSLPQIPQKPEVRAEALTAASYDIVPTIAAPHSTSVNAVAATPDMRWVFSGGADGYIRKFNWVDTANGKLPLTVAQRHPFVDSVTKAAIIQSYWENEEPLDAVSNLSDDPNNLSPVYSLAVHHQALWILSGLESGGINLQSVRHDEGKRITCLKGHKSTVSVLAMAEDERSLLSGSWDKTIKDWDLNTGQVRSTFAGSGGQIASIEFRPLSSVPVPEDSMANEAERNTFSSSDVFKASAGGNLSNGIASSENNNMNVHQHDERAQGSPDDSSLFGDQNSLFGDANDGILGNSNNAKFDDDDDDEFSRAIANGIQQQEDADAAALAQAQAQAQAELDAPQLGGPVQAPEQTATENRTTESENHTTSINPATTIDADTAMPDSIPATNGVSSEPTEDNNDPTTDQNPKPLQTATQEQEQDRSTASESTFLDASIDGTLRIWDRRQPSPVARISPRKGVPPWCMNASWSPDGNTIYAGRRNGTVEEYSLHKSLREPERIFRFPADSGAVSAVKPMPNGRHLVCASHDILRLYDLRQSENTKSSLVPFLIVPGHRTGMVSHLHLDPTCTFLISTGGNRGWEGSATEVLLGYEIGVVGG